MSCKTHASDPVVAQTLEEMATKSMEAGVPVPETLTPEKVREILNYTCDFLESYLRSNPPTNPSDFILLKVREGDEVMKRFHFDENEIASALAQYAIDKNPEWADIREKLSSVMKNALGFDPSMMGF